MLKVRIIPTLLWKDFGLVKGVSFNSWRRIGAILPAIKVYNKRQVDELIVVDIAATLKKEPPDIASISDFSSECFVPLTVGGGIRDIVDAKNILKAGADKICLNSIAYENPGVIRDISDMFGSQCVVVSIDARRNERGRFECYSHCGSIATGKDPGEWARHVESLGAGEILSTSIEKDGTMNGYDIKLIKKITDNVNIPVIASGGAGNYEHMLAAILEAKASAVAAASIFQFTQMTPLGAKQFLGKHNIMVRI